MHITQSLNRAATINPFGIASIFRDRRRTWAEIVDRIARIAGGLARLGVAKGTRVAVLALNSDRYFEALFAIPAAGAIIVPINTRLAAAEIAYILEDSGAKMLFLDDAFVDLAGQFASVTDLIYLGDGSTPTGMRRYESLLAPEPARCSFNIGGDDVAGIFYTGGTTGRSKGVMLSHGNLVSNAASVVPAIGYDIGSIYAHAGPMFHLADGMSTFAVTMVGGTHVFIPRFDTADVLAEIARNRVTHTLLVPTMISAIVNFPDLPQYDLSSLRVVAYGASPVPEAVRHRMNIALPDAHFLQVYGMTEAGPLVTAMDIEATGDRTRSCGRPALLVDVRVADVEEKEVPRGAVGEIQVRGPNIMLGYWNQPEATNFALRGGWYHTGDGGIMDADGYVYVVDRLKDMIITGGENVYPAEVESAISTLDGVAEVAVIGIPDDHWGEIVHAVVVPRLGSKLTADQVIGHSRSLIAHYKCPRSVQLRELPLPLSGAGKVLKTQLREPFWVGRETRIA